MPLTSPPILPYFFLSPQYFPLSTIIFYFSILIPPTFSSYFCPPIFSYFFLSPLLCPPISPYYFFLYFHHNAPYFCVPFFSNFPLSSPYFSPHIFPYFFYPPPPPPPIFPSYISLLFVLLFHFNVPYFCVPFFFKFFLKVYSSWIKKSELKIKPSQKKSYPRPPPKKTTIFFFFLGGGVKVICVRLKPVIFKVNLF